MKSVLRAGALAFLTAAVTLSVQVLVHRMVSAKLLNNFAFLVISMTMLGFAFSGVVLSLWRRLLDHSDDLIVTSASLFGLSLVAAAAVFYHAPSPEDWGASRFGLWRALLLCLPLSLVFAVPFAFCGTILGSLLSEPRLPAARIYCFDLVGSAFGAFLAIPAISHLGVENSVLLSAGLLLVGALALTSPRLWISRASALAAGVALVASAAGRERLFEMRYPRGSVLEEATRPGSGYVLERVVWDPVARIEMCRSPAPDPKTYYWPALIGGNRSFHSRFRRILTQNNNAFTFAVDYDGNADSLRGIEETIYASAYEATSLPSPRVLVIGVGGGFDILTALAFGASDITGVEVNSATVWMLQDGYRDYFKSWVADPRVHLVPSEGRNYLARSAGKYDVIQLSGVDSASGTPAAAHVFSENYLYSTEAFGLYLSHLTDDGIVNMMRPEWLPPREMLRVLTTAVAALRRMGAARPAEHLVMLTAANGEFGALLMKRQPFTASEREHLLSWAARSPFFGVSAAPGLNSQKRNVYQAFLALEEPRLEAQFLNAYPFDVHPVDDDRPFFFKYSLWRHLFSTDPLLSASPPVMEYTLLVLLATAIAAALVCIYLPLRTLAREQLAVPGAGRFALFFAGTGLGYMAIEIGLLQKFGLFLGHPNYALSVVLAALLMATGVGSLLSSRIVGALGRPRYVAYVLAAVVFAEDALAMPRLSGLVGLPFFERVAVVTVLVAPIGVCLGTFFPSALEVLKPRAPAFIPWAWGINGMFSVVGPILSVGFSMTWGIEALLLAAVPVYVVAGLALPEVLPSGPHT